MKRILVLASLLLLLASTLAAGYSETRSNCYSCHSSSSASGGYKYVLPELQLDVPGFVEPDTDFVLNMKLLFSDYEIEEAEFTLSADEDMLVFTEDVVKRSGLSNGDEVSIGGKTKGQGVVEIKVIARVDVYYDHNVGSYDDRGTEILEKTAVLTVGSTSLIPSHWSILLKKDPVPVQLKAKEDITDIEITAPYGVHVLPQTIAKLDSGKTAVITLEADSSSSINENIIITWNEGGNQRALSINVVHRASSGSGSDGLHLMGRITGIASIFLLLASLIFGGLWNSRNALKKMMSAKTRIKIHCGISWFLFALALYHGIILLVGPYNSQIWERPVIIGDIAAFGMLIAALSGGLMKWMIRKFGRKAWRIIHLYSTLGALVLGTLHGIQMGTDTDFIRETPPLRIFIMAVVIIGSIISLIMLHRSNKTKKAVTPRGDHRVKFRSN